jgi:putative DNA primase/helicase
MLDTFDRAVGRWAEILPHFGISPAMLNKRHRPCPVCGGKDRFRFTDKQGHGTYFCNQCGPGNGFTLIKKIAGLDFKDAATKIDQILGNTKPVEAKQDDERASRKAMKEAWESAVKPTANSSVGLYLESRLHRFWKSDAIRQVGNNMIARVSDVNDRGVNMHITYLTARGKKADVTPQKRVMRGTLPAGCAIRLWEPREVMGIAEGIETAMSAAILFRMPVWAAVSGVMLSKWEPPAIAKKIVVFGDNDLSFTGQAKAYELAHRLTVKNGLEVDVEIPAAPGTDWNDVLLQRG